MSEIIAMVSALMTSGMRYISVASASAMRAQRKYPITRPTGIAIRVRIASSPNRMADTSALVRPMIRSVARSRPRSESEILALL